MFYFELNETEIKLDCIAYRFVMSYHHEMIHPLRSHSRRHGNPLLPLW